MAEAKSATAIKMTDADPTDLTIDDSVCIERRPCQHAVELHFGSERKKVQMSGVEIVALLTKLGKPIPQHFEAYVDKPERSGYMRRDRSRRAKDC